MPRIEGLTLYHFPGCAYCGRVEYALRDLGLEVERADITLDSQARQRLQEATGRTTVPVLRIHGREHDERLPASIDRAPLGRDLRGERWIAESTDIVRHLYAEYGDGAKPPLRVWITPAHVVLFIAVLVFALSQLLR